VARSKKVVIREVCDASRKTMLLEGEVVEVKWVFTQVGDEDGEGSAAINFMMSRTSRYKQPRREPDDSHRNDEVMYILKYPVFRVRSRAVVKVQERNALISETSGLG
jgi:hypothetical protein